jgi:hypothetical protein
MYKFGVKLIQENDGRFAVALLDFPSGPRGEGASAQEAYQDLIAKTASGLTKFLVGGGRPAPIADGVPSVSISLPAAVNATPPPPPPQAASTGVMIGPRDKGYMWNYSWRNNTLSTEG